MGLSTNTYVYSGGSNVFPVNFTLGFLSRDHVFVNSGTDPISFEWVDDSNIRILTNIAVGTEITIYRVTPVGALEVSFTAADDVTHFGLDKQAMQALMVTQELIDRGLGGAVSANIEALVAAAIDNLDLSATDAPTVTFSDVAAFKASSDTLATGTRVTLDNGFTYVVVPVGSDEGDVSNANGVLLSAVANAAGEFYLGQFDPTYGEGTTDATPTLVRAATRAAGRTLRIDGDLTLLTTAEFDVLTDIRGGGYTLFDPNNLDNVLWLKVSGSSIKDMNLVGVETAASFAANPPTDATVVSGVTVGGAKSFIRVETPSTTNSAILVGATISNITASGKHTVVTCKRHRGCTVENVTMTGFLPNVLPGQTPVPNSRFCAAVVFLGGSYSLASNIRADNHGAIVLCGLTELGLIVDAASGSNLSDNGVYISSGTNVRVKNCIDITNVTGTGVKMRGSGNIVENCTVRLCNVGYNATGNGITADAYGANGHGIKILSCTAEQTYGYCFQVTAQDGLLARDVTVDDFLSVGGGTAGGGFSAAMRVLSGGQVINSTFRDHKGGSYALIINGVSSSYSRDVTVTNNKFINCANVGVRLQYVSGGVVSNNVGDDNVADLIEYRYVNFTNCYGNVSTINGTVPADVIVWSSSYPGDGNNFTCNTGRTYIHPDLRGRNYVAPQWGSIASLGVITEAPAAVGQVATGNGLMYIANGVASTDNWIAIS